MPRVTLESTLELIQDSIDFSHRPLPANVISPVTIIPPTDADVTDLISLLCQNITSAVSLTNQNSSIKQEKSWPRFVPLTRCARLPSTRLKLPPFLTTDR